MADQTYLHGNMNKSTSKSNTHAHSCSTSWQGGQQPSRTDAGSRAVSWGARGHRGTASASWSVKGLQLHSLVSASDRQNFLIYVLPGNWAFLRWEFRLAGERRKYSICIAQKVLESGVHLKKPQIIQLAHSRLTHILTDKSYFNSIHFHQNKSYF